MNLPSKLLKIQKIAFEITDGDIDHIDLNCPYCKNSSLEFSFTIKRSSHYGLFIKCKNCGQFHHFSLDQKPKNFRKGLVLEKYQFIEDEAMRRAENIGKKLPKQ